MGLVELVGLAKASMSIGSSEGRPVKDFIQLVNMVIPTEQVNPPNSGRREVLDKVEHR